MISALMEKTVGQLILITINQSIHCLLLRSCENKRSPHNNEIIAMHETLAKLIFKGCLLIGQLK